MLCAICGKEMGETELGKQYCYDCEKKWLDDNADKRGYAQAVKDIFEKIDSILNVDVSHSYMSDSFILSQSKYTQIKKEFLSKSADYNGLIPIFELGAKK